MVLSQGKGFQAPGRDRVASPQPTPICLYLGPKKDHKRNTQPLAMCLHGRGQPMLPGTPLSLWTWYLLQVSPEMVSIQDLQLNNRYLSILISKEALQELSVNISTHTSLLTFAFCCRRWSEICSPRHTSPPPSLPFAPVPLLLFHPSFLSRARKCVPMWLSPSPLSVITGGTSLLCFLLLLAGIFVALQRSSELTKESRTDQKQLCA